MDRVSGGPGANSARAVAMLDDGVYGLSFESREHSGCGSISNSSSEPDVGCSRCEGVSLAEGLAVLRSGRILGSDPYGGVFRGCYRYDAARDEVFVEVRLSIPPNGVLLTGLEAGPDGAFVDVSGRFCTTTLRSSRPVSSAVVDVAGAQVRVELRFVGAL
jgi:hypothetical protein